MARPRVTGKPMESFKIGNDLACKVLKVGIPTKALDSVGEFLGVSKSMMTSCLDLDQAQVNRLAAKDQRLPTHAADIVLRLLGT